MGAPAGLKQMRTVYQDRRLGVSRASTAVLLHCEHGKSFASSLTNRLNYLIIRTALATHPPRYNVSARRELSGPNALVSQRGPRSALDTLMVVISDDASELNCILVLAQRGSTLPFVRYQLAFSRSRTRADYGARELSDTYSGR